MSLWVSHMCDVFPLFVCVDLGKITLSRPRCVIWPHPDSNLLTTQRCRAGGGWDSLFRAGPRGKASGSLLLMQALQDEV